MDLSDDDVRSLLTRLREGSDGSAVEVALAFLEEDPWYFRSGYHRNRIVGALADAPLSGRALERARAVVLGTVDGRLHSGGAGVHRLAGAVADNELRRALRARLHHPDRVSSGVPPTRCGGSAIPVSPPPTSPPCARSSSTRPVSASG